MRPLVSGYLDLESGFNRKQPSSIITDIGPTWALGGQWSTATKGSLILPPHYAYRPVKKVAI